MSVVNENDTSIKILKYFVKFFFVELLSIIESSKSYIIVEIVFSFDTK